MKPDEIMLLAIAGVFIGILCNFPVLAFSCVALAGISFWIGIQ